MSKSSIDEKDSIIDIGICGVLLPEERKHIMSKRVGYLWIYDSLDVNGIIGNICLAVGELDIERANIFFISYILDGEEEILQDHGVGYNNAAEKDNKTDNTTEKDSSSSSSGAAFHTEVNVSNNKIDNSSSSNRSKRYSIEYLIGKLKEICITNKNKRCITLEEIRYIYINRYTDKNISTYPISDGIMRNRNKIHIPYEKHKADVMNHILVEYI